MASSVDALGIIGRTTLANNPDSTEFEGLLRQHAQLRPAWRGAFLIAANGDVLVNATFPVDQRMPSGKTNVLDRPEFRSMLTQPRPMVSNLMTRREDGVYTTAVAVPVIESGKLRYVVGAWIDITAWQALLESAGRRADGFLCIYDREHYVARAHARPRRFVGQPAATRRDGLDQVRLPGTSARR